MLGSSAGCFFSSENPTAVSCYCLDFLLRAHAVKQSINKLHSTVLLSQ